MASLTATADAHVRSDNPDLKLGTEDYMYIAENAEGDTAEIYVNFNISGITAGSSINSAVLRLYQYDSDNDWLSVTIPVVAELATSAWSETEIKWSNKPGSLSNPQAPKSFANNISTSVDFDVKPHIEAILAGTAWYGFRLRYTGTASSTRKALRSRQYSDSSKWPVLIVDYTLPTAPGPATGLKIEPNLFETRPRLSWNAGANGTNNPITGYEVKYQVSDDKIIWNDAGTDETLAGVRYYDIPAEIFATWNRGKYMWFQVGSKSAHKPTVWSDFSLYARKNRVPLAPTNVKTTKTCYAPGEAIRVTLTSGGDPDNNLKGFEVAKMDSETPEGDNYSSTAAYVDVSTSIGTWAPGVSYPLRVHAVDGLGAVSEWVNVSAVMVGLPMFVQTVADGVFKRAVSMQVYVPGLGFKTAVGMKIASVQGPIDKTIF